MLERVNPLQVIGLRKTSRPEKWIPGFTQAIFALAKRKIGALVIIERRDRVQEFVAEGQTLEGDPGRELLMSIFQKESPLHDGAMLIQGGRVTQVACYLPLSSDERLPKEWGTRHRAALGLSERCDAWVVVSEERGAVSLARKKEMVQVGNSQELSQLILEAIMPISPVRKSWWERIHFFLVNRWHVKVGTLFLVATLWLMLAGQQDFEKTVSVPLGITNTPSQLEILEPVNPMLEIKVRGLRKDVSTLDEKNVMAEIDVSSARFARRSFSITWDNIRLPNERMYVVDIDSPQLKFNFKEKP